MISHASSLYGLPYKDNKNSIVVCAVRKTGENRKESR
jgi:hypothetical protein